MNLRKLLEQIGIEIHNFEDLHITRFHCAFVVVSKGKVVKVTEPHLHYCPLASFLYSAIRQLKGFDSELMKEAISKSVEEKISKFGLFTENRGVYREDIAVPFGASEMMMYAMRKGIIDAAVVVCDGAGTVIADKPEIVQGIGARMNGLFYTTPIQKTMKELEAKNCRVVFPEANIEQAKGLEKAAETGCKNVAVTINGYMNEDLSKVKEIESKYGISVTSLIVCTTDVSEERIQEIKEHADLVWSCASKGIREIVGEKAILQLSTGIPVFVLTQKGLDFVAGYSSDVELIRNLNPEKQYVISTARKDKGIRMGNFDTYLGEAKLPVRSAREPRLAR